MARKLKANLILGIAILFVSSKAWAFNFVPTEPEFKSWDKRCKALYVSTIIGRNSIFASQVPPNQVKYFRDLDKEGGWHYCAGLIYMRRAKLEVLDAKKRDAILDRAEKEIMFTHSRIAKEKAFYAEIEVAPGQFTVDER